MEALFWRLAEALHTMAYPQHTTYGFLEGAIGPHTGSILFAVFSGTALLFIAACVSRELELEPQAVGGVFAGLVAVSIVGFAMIRPEKQLFAATLSYWAAAYYGMTKPAILIGYGFFGAWAGEHALPSLAVALAIVLSLTLLPGLQLIIAVGGIAIALLFLAGFMTSQPIAADPIGFCAAMALMAAGAIASPEYFAGHSFYHDGSMLWYSIVALDHLPWLVFVVAFLVHWRVPLTYGTQLARATGQGLHRIRRIPVPEVQLPKITFPKPQKRRVQKNAPHQRPRQRR